MTLLNAAGDPQPQPLPFRIAVAIPSNDHVPMGFAFDLAQMVGATVAARPDLDIRLTNVQGTIIHVSRKDLVRMAIKNDCTHILFVDSDMRFPRYALCRLLHHNVPIVAANYVTRRSPTVPVTFANDTGPLDRVFTEPGEEGLVEVASTGLGMCLIDLDVFRALSEPWFSFAWNEQNQVIGEDVWFFRKAREELGLKVMLDHGLSQSIKHIGVHEYTMADALVSRALKAEAGEKTAE